MSDTYQLDEMEAKFFETGEVDPALATQLHETPAEDAPEPPLVVDEVAEAPAPAPAPLIPDEDPYRVQLERQNEARRQELEGKLSDLTKQLEQMKAPVAPDREADPYGYLLHKIETVAKQIESIQNQSATNTQEMQQREAQQQFVNAVNGSIAAFTKDHPDYQDAYKHLREAKFKEARELGYSVDEANQKLNQEEFDITLRAMKANKSPAEIAYNLAQRYGYKVPQPSSDPTSKVEQIKKGLKAETPQPSGKPSGTNGHTLESLKNASDADINKMVDGDNWEKLFGVKSSKDIF